MDTHEVGPLPFPSTLRLLNDAWRPVTLTFSRRVLHAVPEPEPEPEPGPDAALLEHQRTSLSLSIGSAAMVEHHRDAQLELVRNSIIAGTQ
eukprot:COSAG01_NODE_4641_length_4858_cov_6.174827_1_plen_91_part_00